MAKALFEHTQAELWYYCPELRGKRVADIPKLAGFRIKYRRLQRRNAEAALAIALLNLILAFGLGDGNWFWMLNAASAWVGFCTMIYAELKALELSRQLRRGAIEQIARDLLEMKG